LNQQDDALEISENTSVTAMDEIGAEIREAKTAELPPRDISGLKWALVVLSILSSTFPFRARQHCRCRCPTSYCYTLQFNWQAHLAQCSLLNRCSIDELGLGQDLSLVGIDAPWGIAGCDAMR
jgi:hypothetical protein